MGVLFPRQQELTEQHGYLSNSWTVFRNEVMEHCHRNHLGFAERLRRTDQMRDHWHQMRQGRSPIMTGDEVNDLVGTSDEPAEDLD